MFLLTTSQESSTDPDPAKPTFLAPMIPRYLCSYVKEMYFAGGSAGP